ncbi:MAG: tetraacyldisaccharide 4'-kinase, partial [Nitrospinota bacterium]
ESVYILVKSIIEQKGPVQKNRALACLLQLLSYPYGGVVSCRHLAYRFKLFQARKLPVPVISVGNLTLGGTGKTPVVSLLTRLLVNKGVRPAIVSRGYGGMASEGVNVVSDGNTLLLNAEFSGDEPFMLARKFPGVPVVTGKSRYRAGLFACKDLHAELVILDDGYQHMQLFRDLNILLLDGQEFFGNGYLFPRGPLREPEGQKKRADLIWFTKCQKEAGGPKTDIGMVPVVCSGIRPLKLQSFDGKIQNSINAISGKSVYAFCGIGAPVSFFTLLKSVGATITGQSIFEDHHQYRADEIENIVSKALKAGAEYIVTTEKDSVRIQLPRDPAIPFFFLTMEVEIWEGQDELEKAVYALLR